jgi:hypothetical protein
MAVAPASLGFFSAGRGALGIHRLLEHQAFEPDRVAAMGQAYDAALAKLGLLDAAEHVCERVARRVIEFAQCGERDAERLCALVVRSFAGE